METWKDALGYEGLYRVSSLGRVKNNSGHILSPVDNGNGYLRYNLSKGKRNYATKYLHRLVAEAFIPNPNNLPEINHKDENKRNNAIDNLEWCTTQYNRSYGTRIQRYSEKNKKKTIGISLVNKSIIVLNGAVDAERLGLNKSAVSNCAQGLSKSSGGYKWQYV